MRAPHLPCRVEETTGACFAVRDANGKSVAYMYYGSGSRLVAVPDLWSREEAQAIADRIAQGFTLASERAREP